MDDAVDLERVTRHPFGDDASGFVAGGADAEADTDVRGPGRMDSVNFSELTELVRKGAVTGRLAAAGAVEVSGQNGERLGVLMDADLYQLLHGIRRLAENPQSYRAFFEGAERKAAAPHRRVTYNEVFRPR